MIVGIVDLGIGNINSVHKALSHLGATTLISYKPSELSTVDKLVLPGVGSYSKAAASLDTLDLRLFLQDISQHKALLGICVGMQILSTQGEENGLFSGLGLIPGRVAKMDISERLPHVGWNSIAPNGQCPLFNNIDEGACFYFTHSYHFKLDDKQYSAAITQYGLDFSSAVFKDRIYGVQFHPEKSQQHGMALLKNFLELG